MKYELENHTEALVIGLLTKAMDTSKLVDFDCSHVSELFSSDRVFISVSGEDKSYFVITRFDTEDEEVYDFDITAGIYSGEHPGMTLDMNLEFDKDSAVNQNFERLIEVLNGFVRAQKAKISHKQ